MIELKYLVGAVETPFYNIKLKDFTHSSEFMAEAVISAEIALLEDITDDEWKTSFLSYQGETWRCFTPPAKKKGSTQLEYIYTLTYKPESEILKGIKFLDRVSVLPKLTTGLSVVAYSGGISEFADRLSANLARIGGWNVYVEAGLDDTPKDITIDNQYVWDALATIPDEYKYKYTIKGKKIYIWNTVGYVFPDTFKVGDTISHEFQYGKDNGLYEINKSVTEDKVLGYVRGSGSERNIPLNYYRDSERFAANPCPDYAPALMPKIYTQGDPTAIPPIAPWEVDYYKNDAEIAKGNITEEFVRFDGTDGNEEIYPTIKGVTYNNLPIDELLMVGDIGSDEISDTGKVIDDEFDVTLNPLGFNLSKCISAKGEMIMNMQSGMCSGANFKIVGINGKRTNGVNNAKNYYFFPKLVLDDTYWWGSHSEDVVLGFYGQGQGEQTLAYTKEMKWGEGSILRNDSVQIGDGVNVTLTPLMRDRYSDAEIILQGGGSWPLLYGSSVNLEGLVAIAEQEVKDVNLGYLPAGMWDLVMRISYNTVGTEDIIGGGYLYLPFDKDVPFMTDKGTIVFPDNIQDTSITLTLQKSLGDYDILIPNATLYPQAGDKFVLINADLPDFLVIAAEERLENALKAYRDSHAYNKFNYDINIDSKFINDNPSIASLLKVGNRLKIGSEALNILNVSTEYKRDSIFPNYTVRVSPTTQRVVSTKRATAEKADKVATDTSMILKALVATNRDTINRTVALEVRASGINAGAEPQDRVEIYPNYSNGANQIPSIVDNGNGTVTLGAGQYNLSSNASGAGLINLYTITGGTFNLVNDAQNYIVANYNNGTPIVEVINNVELINETTIIPIYSVYRNGNVLHITNWDALGLALSNKIHQSIVKTQRYRRESGLSLSENGSRNLTLSTGRVWTGAVPITLAEINTAVDNIRFWYKVGGVWTFSLTPTYNNTHYCNGTDLVELTSNRYAINWVFRGVESQNHLYIVVGSGDYTLAQAQGATVPALPVGISSHATLVGKIIVQKGANTATSIQSAFDAQFSYSSPTAHNDMTGIQGGVAGDHQHFTTQEKTIATQSANATRNGYLTSSDWSKFDTAYNDRLKWDGGASSLNAANGRASLGLGTAALNNTSDFLGATAQAVDSAKLGGQLPSYYQVNIATGLSTDYYTGNKTWADFSTAVRATSLLGYVVGANSPLLATDTIMQAFGKVQGQINARALSTDLTAHTGNGNIHLTNDEKAYLIKLYTYLKFASDNSSLYSTINFYSESGVSAYGIGTGGGGGAGVDIIDNLLSVRADAALSANQGRILKGYIDLKQPQLNGTGLVRMSGTGVTYDNNSYALASSLSDYLHLTNGGTVSAQAYFTGAPVFSNTFSLYVRRPSEGNPNIVMQNHDSLGNVRTLGYLTMLADDNLGFFRADGTTYRTVLHSGNFSSYALPSSALNYLQIAHSASSGTINDTYINYIGYVAGANLFGQTDGGLITTIYSSAWQHQIFGDFRTGQVAIRGKNQGAWQPFRIVLDSGNYSSYAASRVDATISSAGATPLTLYTGGNTVDNFINFSNDGQSVKFGVRNPYSSYGLTLVTPSNNYYRILHEGNYGSFVLPLSGGILGGSLLFNGYQDIAWNGGWGNGGTTLVGSANGLVIYPKGNIGGGVVTIAGQGDVIHSGNIGSQSVNYAASAGNANTLGGQSLGYFVRQGSINTDYWNQGQSFVADWHGTLPDGLSGVYNYGTGITINGSTASLQIYAPENSGGRSGDLWYRTGWAATKRDWLKVWHAGNLTQNLNAGNLPYWNGSTLIDSGISYSSGNIYSNSRTFITDGTNYISIGQWDGVNNRIEGVNRPVYITSYTGGVKLGYAGNIDLIIDSNRKVSIGAVSNTNNLHLNGLASGTIHGADGYFGLTADTIFAFYDSNARIRRLNSKLDFYGNNGYTFNAGANTYFDVLIDFKVGTSKRIGWEYGDGNMYNWITNSYTNTGGIEYKSGSWTSGNIVAHNFETWQGSDWSTAFKIYQDQTAYFSRSVYVTNGTLSLSRGSGEAYSTKISTEYTYPYVDTFIDSIAGTSYQGRFIFRTSAEGGALGNRFILTHYGEGIFSGTVIAPTFNTGGYRPVTIGQGYVSMKSDAGGYAMRYGFIGSSGTDRGGFGAYGNADGLEYYFIGASYSNYIVRYDYSNKMSVFMGGALLNGPLSLYQGSANVNYPLHTKQATHQYLHIEGDGSYESMIRYTNINGSWYVGMRTANTLSDFQFYAVSTATTVANLTQAGRFSVRDSIESPVYDFKDRYYRLGYAETNWLYIVNYSAGNALNLKVGGLLVSGSYADYVNVPSNGIWAAGSIHSATSIKIGANWEAIPNGNDLELRYGGVMKAKLSSSGDILAVGGVTAFAV